MKNSLISYVALFIVLFLNSESLNAKEVKKVIYFVGGGGEPYGNSTIFDADTKNFSKFVKSSDWETTVSFNGGHKNTDSIISNMKAANAGPFTHENYQRLLNEMIQKIEIGELGEGDQLLLNIYSHGSPKELEKTQKILTKDGAVNLDGLEKLANLASSKGVKLAIVNLGCFSGNLLSIKNEKVCLISGTGPEQYAYAASFDAGIGNIQLSFTGKFIDLYKKGSNLEDIFLEARNRGKYLPDFPMISTEEGRTIQSKIYDLMSSSLSFDKETSQKYDINSIDEFNQQVCKIESQHEELKKLLTFYSDVESQFENRPSNEFKALIKALTEYRNHQIKNEEMMRKDAMASEEIRAILRKDYPNHTNSWEHYDPITFMQVKHNFHEILMSLDSSEEELDKEILKRLEGLRQSPIIQKEMMKKLSPETLSQISKINDYEYGSMKVKLLASNVSYQAKKVYASLYKSLRKKESNPCRNFVL